MASWRFIIKYIVCARIVLSVQYFQNKTDLVTKFGSDLHSQGSNSHHRLSQMTFVRSLPSPKQYKYSRRLQLQNSHPPNNKLPRIVSQTNNNHDYRGYDSHLGSSNEYLTLLINGNESQSLANLSSVFKSSTVIYPRYTTKLPNIIYPENSSYPGPGNSGYRGQGKENAGTHPALKVSTNSAVIGGEPPEKHPSCFSLPVVGDCLGAFKRFGLYAVYIESYN